MARTAGTLRLIAPGAQTSGPDEFCWLHESDECSTLPRKGTAMTEPKTYTLEAPGAVLHYDVRANDDSTKPALLIIGSPMGPPDSARWRSTSPTERS